MKVFYWFLKFFILFAATIIGSFVFDQTGSWGVIGLVLIVLWGENYLDNRLSELKLRRITDRLLILKLLESGDQVTITLKNWKVFSNFVFSFFTEYDIIVSRKMTLEQVLEGKDDTKWIKFNKIREIEKVLDRLQ